MGLPLNISISLNGWVSKRMEYNACCHFIMLLILLNEIETKMEMEDAEDGILVA